MSGAPQNSLALVPAWEWRRAFYISASTQFISGKHAPYISLSVRFLPVALALRCGSVALPVCPGGEAPQHAPPGQQLPPERPRLPLANSPRQGPRASPPPAGQPCTCLLSPPVYECVGVGGFGLRLRYETPGKTPLSVLFRL